MKEGKDSRSGGKTTGKNQAKARKNTKYKPEFLVKAYEAMRSGLPEVAFAKEIGVSPICIRRWKEDKPEFAEAIASGKALVPRKKRGFSDYVYGQLPEDLQKTWREVMKLEGMADRLCKMGRRQVRKVRTLIKAHRRKHKQMLFLHALCHNRYNWSKTSEMVGIHKRTVQRWMRRSRQFAELIKGIVEVKKDFVDEALMKLIERGSEGATIFAARTLLRDRGYGDKLQVEMSGEVSVKLEDLNLPAETMRQLLQAIRQQNKTQTGRDAPQLGHNPDLESVQDAEFSVVEEVNPKPPKKKGKKA
jgi:hypothetical protein